MNEIEMKARIAELEAQLAAVQQGVQPVQAVPVAKNGRKVLVDAGALQMVLNALERDARAGHQVRAEMRFDLMQSITHPTQQGLDAQNCDMFWVADDPDGQHDTLHDAVVRAFEDGGIDADGCVEIQCAKSIPNIVVRITGVKPFAFKVIPDSELAAQVKQGE